MSGDLVHSSDQGENEGNREGKNPTKFGEESSIMADGLCFDSLCLLTWRNFLHHPEFSYDQPYPFSGFGR